MEKPLAVFGGTFDPIHLGHLRSALEVCEELDLGQVLFMPCAQTPHAKDVEASDFHRLEMARLAIQDNPRFVLCDLEVRQGGTSYTSRTLTLLSKMYPGRRLYFLIGSDAFFKLHSWNSHATLFDLADFIVMERPGTPERDLAHYIRTHLSQECTDQSDGWVRLPSGGGARRVTTTLLDISSTEIRRRAVAGFSLAYLVPPAVEDYINKKKLYKLQTNP